MRAKFVGNGDSDPALLSWGGVVWPFGQPVDVPPALEAKVRGSSHFEVIRGRPPKKKEPVNDEDGFGSGGKGA